MTYLSRARKLAPPSGPQYYLFELAVLCWSASLLVYAIPALRQLAEQTSGRPPSAVSSAEAWLTLPGQAAAGILGMIGFAIVAALCYKASTMRAATIMLCIAVLAWSLTLIFGMVFSPVPWRPGSVFFVIGSVFAAQIGRRYYDAHRKTEDFLAACQRPHHD